MSLSVGIVGLPNVGKSTLFNALSKNNALAANYPFATIEPNVGIVNLEDEKLNNLAKFSNTQTIVKANVTFTDIAGIVKGASEGEGLGNKFLANIRECNAICEVVRVFEDGNVVHVDGSVDYKRDIETINTELILADIQTLNNQIPNLEKQVRGQDKDAKLRLELAQKLLNSLNDGITVAQTIKDDKNIDEEDVRGFFLLSAKPFIYVFNLDENQLKNETLKTELTSSVAPFPCIFLNAYLESELIDLSDEEAKEMLDDYGIKDSGLNQLARVAFETLKLQTFYTTGEKETRAWEIKQGWTAPKAAGVIHTDFEKGFIKAQVISYDDLIEAGSMVEAKAKGKVRIEGKDYVMKPDDIVEFMFNN